MFEFFVFGLLSFEKIAKFAKISTPKVFLLTLNALRSLKKHHFSEFPDIREIAGAYCIYIFHVPVCFQEAVYIPHEISHARYLSYNEGEVKRFHGSLRFQEAVYNPHEALNAIEHKCFVNIECCIYETLVKTR